MKCFTLLTAILTLSFIGQVRAQTESFHPFTINPGIGSGGIYYNGYSNKAKPNPTLSLDFMLRPKVGIGRISLGLTGSYTKVEYGYIPNTTQPFGGGEALTEYGTYNSIMIGVRAAYHFIVKPKVLDPFAGILGDYVSQNYPPLMGEPIPNTSPYHVGYYAGIRYFFLPWLGVYAEVGRNGFSIATGGLSFRP